MADRRLQKAFFYLIRREALEHLSPGELLDMLRYDGARVLNNPPAGFYLLTSESAPAEARWKSFGVHIADVSDSRDRLALRHGALERVKTKP